MKDFVKQPDFGQKAKAWPQTPAERTDSAQSTDTSQAGPDLDTCDLTEQIQNLHQRVWREVDRQMQRQSMAQAPEEPDETGPGAGARRPSAAKTFADVMREAEAPKPEACVPAALRGAAGAPGLMKKP